MQITYLEGQLKSTQLALDAARAEHEETKVTLNGTIEKIKKKSEDHIFLLKTGLTKLNDETLAELDLTVTEKNKLAASVQEQTAFIEKQVRNERSRREAPRMMAPA